MKVTATAFLFALFSIEVFASGSTGQMEISSITQRNCSNDHDFEVAFKAPHANPDGCSNTTTVNFACTHPAINQIVSIALAAHVSGKKVDAWVDGCDFGGQAKGTTLKIYE